MGLLRKYRLFGSVLLILVLSFLSSMFTLVYHLGHMKDLRKRKASALHIRHIINLKANAITIRNSASLGLGETVLSAMNQSANETDGDFDNLRVVPLKHATKAVVQSLYDSIPNVEQEILKFDVNDILKPLSDIPLEENRLVHKIQRKQRDANFKCVIRIAKYCSGRCDYLVKGNHSRVWKPFRCEFSEFCRFETRFIRNLNREIMQSIDVVLFTPPGRDVRLWEVMAVRPPGQLWVIYTKESPHHDIGFAPPGLKGNPFNLTMTYASDSDIYFPYGSVRKRKKPGADPLEIPKKTKLIAWVASNCNPYFWKRTDLVKAIQKYIPVDTYGRCGVKKLAHENATKTLEQYKFYLSFENSECRDYITEKVWKTCFPRGIVPIVYGSTREGYEKALPRNSFIFVEDFSNMSAFVDYIHALDEDQARYMKYFDWRRDNDFQFHSPSAFRGRSPELNFCYLLKKLIHLSVYPETSWHKRNPDFSSWWLGQCDDHSTAKIVLGFNTHRSKEEQARLGRWE